MLTTESDFLADARVRLGRPSLDEVPNDLMQRALAGALRDFSKIRYFNWQPVIITLQPFQEIYTLGPPAPTFVFDVIPAAPTTASARAFGNEFRALELDLVSFMISDLMAFQYKVSEYREMFEQIDWHYTEPPTLWISPSPVQALQAIVITGDVHTIATVAEGDYETLMSGLLANAFKFWADIRDSLATLEVPSSLGTLTLKDGTKFRERAVQEQTKFENRLGWNRPYIGQG